MPLNSERFCKKGLAIALGTLPLTGLMLARNVRADDAEPIRFTGSAAEVQGQTAGEENLAQLSARDRRRKVCLGFAAPEPNHVLVLPNDQPRLQVAVDSDGSDTTLLIRGPRGIDCNDNARRDRRDAAVTDSNWPAGRYEIWVGSFNRGDRLNYTLRVSEPNRTGARNLSKDRLSPSDNRPDEGVGVELTKR